MKASLSRPSSSLSTPTRFASSVVASPPCPKRIGSRFSRSAFLLNTSVHRNTAQWRRYATAGEEEEWSDTVEVASAFFVDDEGQEEFDAEETDTEEPTPEYSINDDDDSDERPRKKGDFEERVLELRRVATTMKGGRKIRFRATMVVGNGKGTVGVGNATAKEIPVACRKAASRAMKELVTFTLFDESFTFPHRQEAKFCASKVVLVPAVDGTGVIAGGAVRVVLEVAGVKNGFGKIVREGTAMNNAKAAVKALGMMRTIPQVAAMRGVSIDYFLGRTFDPYQSACPPSREKEDLEKSEVTDVTGIGGIE